MISSFVSELNSLVKVIIQRITLGFSTITNFDDWLYTVILLLVYGVIALSIGFFAKFLQFNSQFSSKIALKIIVTSLIAPALLEELFFRVILLPHPSEKMSLEIIVYSSITSLLLFVIYHPLNALTFFSRGRATFFNPVFLCLAALLGLICNVAYLQTGSVWGSVIIHWLTVIIWLFYLGGMEKLKLERVNIQ